MCSQSQYLGTVARHPATGESTKWLKNGAFTGSGTDNEPPPVDYWGAAQPKPFGSSGYANWPNSADSGLSKKTWLANATRSSLLGMCPTGRKRMLSATSRRSRLCNVLRDRLTPASALNDLPNEFPARDLRAY